jgi:cytochrome b
MSPTPSQPTKIRVWDLPTRLFHWLLLAGIIGSVTSAQIGGNAMDWHFRFGYLILSLLMFRVVWGLVGGRWSRFAAFIYSPATIFRYMSGKSSPEHSIGHNPLGALSVFALLFVLLLQVMTGLISDDEIASAGPMVKFVAGALVSKATSYHAEVGKLILLGLVILHVGAILFYQFKKRENLIQPMIHGDKAVTVLASASQDNAKTRSLAAVLYLACALCVFGMLKLAA